MGASDLNKVAVAMGRILKQLPDLEDKAKTWFSIDDNKEEFYAMAYVARVSILDIMDKNPYMSNGGLSITIPLGIFKTRKENMATALKITVGRIVELSADHNQVHYIVNDILDRGKWFYEFEKLLHRR